jgi:RNA polymerase sigma factor (sigma-70 family)
MESEAQITQIVEHLFRQEAGKITSALTGSFGLRHLELVEDAVQEALLKALRLWSYGNIPPNRPAWLMQVARNHALDNLRRSTRWHEKEEEIARQQQLSELPEAEPIFADEEIRDDQLRMIFACCHPALGRESQVALTLKLLCGFNVEEIARAFITKSETIAKRLTRARERLRTDAIPFEMPSGAQLEQRLDAVLDVLYLLFNEGYNASQGDELIRRDLCDDAVRLTGLLAEHPTGDKPKTHALLALLLLQAARFPARIDGRGEILLLQDQDRTSWNRELITLGMLHLDRAAAGDSASEFHLQAGIAACHCAAESYEATDWRKIVLLYDLLLELNDSAVIALNRAVALSKVNGPNAGLTALNEIKSRESLKDYYLFHAVLGEFQLASNQSHESESSFRHALSLTNIPAEQNFLRKRLRSITS